MANAIIIKNDLSKQSESVKLDRMDGELSSMLSNLQSYRKEPQTLKMHAQYLKLKGRGKRLRYHIERANRLLNTSSNLTEDISQEIGKVNQDYDRFQKRFSFYLSEF